MFCFWPADWPAGCIGNCQGSQRRHAAGAIEFGRKPDLRKRRRSNPGVLLRFAHLLPHATRISGSNICSGGAFAERSGSALLSQQLLTRQKLYVILLRFLCGVQEILEKAGLSKALSLEDNDPDADEEGDEGEEEGEGEEKDGVEVDDLAAALANKAKI